MIFRTALCLLRPKFLTFKNSLFFRRPVWYGTLMCVGTALILVCFPLTVFLSVSQSLAELKTSVNPPALLEITTTSFIALIFLAACIHALQIFFLAPDNEIYLLAPLRTGGLFLGKCLENSLSASWILLLIFIPVYFAIGSAAHAPWFYYFSSVIYIVTLTIFLSSLAIAVVIVLSRIYPARRLREAFVIVAIIGVLALHMYDQSSDFLLTDQTAGSLTDNGKILSFWHSQIAKRAQGFVSFPLRLTLEGKLNESISWLLAVMTSAALAYGAAFRIFSDFYQPSGLLERWQQAKRPYRHFWYRRPPATVWGFLQKDTHLFLRDLAQPVQLFAFIGVAAITILSYRQSSVLKSALTGSDLALTDILFTLGIFSHLLLAVLFAGRFIFPALAMEEECRWLIGSSPIKSQRFVRIKFLSYAILGSVVLLPLYLTIAFLTDLTPTHILVGTASALTTTVGVSALAVGSGGFFKLRGDPLHSAGGNMGSFIFMTGALFIIPLLMFLSAGAAVMLCLVATDALNLTGPVYCVLYALMMWALGDLFLRKASRFW